MIDDDDDERKFYKEEKSKFDELLNKLSWTEDCLLNEQESFIQCSMDRGHRFPIGSKHLQTCQLINEGFSKDYLKELAECEKEKQLLNQSGVLFSPLTLSNILHRPVTITNNIPLSVEQTTVLFTPNERSIIAQAVHNEALLMSIVPSTPLSITDNYSIQSQASNSSQQSNKLAELRDQKRRPAKYVTRTTKKSFYDIARDMINIEMELIQEQNHHQIQSDKNQIKQSKHKHRSSSKTKHHKKHRSSSHTSHKHHRHAKKRRKN